MNGFRSPAALLATTPTQQYNSDVQPRLSALQRAIQVLRSASLHLETVRTSPWLDELVFLKKKMATAIAIKAGLIRVEPPYHPENDRELVANGLIEDASRDFHILVGQRAVPKDRIVKVEDFVHDSVNWFMVHEIPQHLYDIIESATKAKDELILHAKLPDNASADLRRHHFQFVNSKPYTLALADLEVLKKKLLAWS